MSRHHKYAPTQPGQPRSSLYGQAAVPKRGGIIHADKFGTDLAMRSATPPPVAEYDAYLKGRNVRSCARNHSPQKTGFRLRRIVVMRRAGSSWGECGAAVGIGPLTARAWVEFLPLELAV